MWWQLKQEYLKLRIKKSSKLVHRKKFQKDSWRTQVNRQEGTGVRSKGGRIG
jgi:hypothetical protein